MNIMQVQPIFDITTEHGEGPIWDVDSQQLYWVDIMQGEYHKGNWESHKVQTFSIGQPLGVLAIREKGGLVMATRDGFGFFDEMTNAFTLIDPSPEQYNPKVRFNDGSVDPAGRFFAGTMEWDGGADIGKLFRLDTDHSWQLLDENIFITNGMGWNPKKNTYFMIDTLRHVMYAYDYNEATGEIANRRVHIQFKDDEFPDGMTIDSEGGFWVAMWGGGKVIHYDSSGIKANEIQVPALHTTSCCFGGPDLNVLFITTSKLPLSIEQRNNNPLAGRTFKVETHAKGQIESKFKG